MKRFNPLNHINTAVAVIDKNMTVIDANDAFKKRNKSSSTIGNKCFQAAYEFNAPCQEKNASVCPVQHSFNTKKTGSTIHHFWINENAVVEEIVTTPVLGDDGKVEFVVEEFRDVTKLLGLNKGLIGICSYCRKLRNKDGKWVSFETYIQQHTGANFTHSICSGCNDELKKNLNK